MFLSQLQKNTDLLHQKFDPELQKQSIQTCVTMTTGPWSGQNDCRTAWRAAIQNERRLENKSEVSRPRYKIRGDSRASLESICLRQSLFEERWHCVTFPVRGIFTSPLFDIPPIGGIVKRQTLEYFSPLRCEQLSGGPLRNERSFNSQIFSWLCGRSPSVMSWNQLKGFGS